MEIKSVILNIYTKGLTSNLFKFGYFAIVMYAILAVEKSQNKSVSSLWMFIFNTVSFLQVFDFGISSYILKKSRLIETSIKYRKIILCNVIFTYLIICGLLIILGYAIFRNSSNLVSFGDVYNRKQFIVYLSILLGISIIPFNGLLTIFIALRDIKTLVAFRMASASLFCILLTISLKFENISLLFLAYPISIISGLGVLLGVLVSNKYISLSRKSSITPLFKKTYKFALVQLAGALFFSIDQFIFPFVLAADEYGSFAAISKFQQLFLLGVDGFLLTLWPTFNSLRDPEIIDKKKLLKVICLITVLVSLIVNLISLYLILPLSNPDLFTQYNNIKYFFLLMILWGVSFNLSSIFGQTLNSVNQLNIQFTLLIVLGILTVILKLYIPKLSHLGYFSINTCVFGLICLPIYAKRTFKCI